MELNGEVLVEAPRPRVWDALNDTEVLRRCIPGCESLVASGDNERSATVAVKVGPVRARFNGRVRLEDVRPGEGCTLHFDGQGGAAGMARGSSRVELVDEAGHTRLRHQTQASVAGKLGQVGGRMIDAAARQMADQFFGALRAELAPAAAASAAPPAAPAAAAGPGPAGPAALEAPAAAATPVATTPAPATRAAQAPAAAPPAVGEAPRVLWFVLGALSTGFGVWLGRVLFS